MAAHHAHHNTDIIATNDLCAIADIAAPNADVSTSNAEVSASSVDVSASSADIVASNDECFMMFHNVLRVFDVVLLVVHDVSQCVS